MKCPYCGYEKNKEGAKECGSCGKRLDVIEDDSKRKGKRKENDLEINTPQLTEVEKLQRLTTTNIKEYYKRYCPMPIVHRMNAIEMTAWVGFAVLWAILFMKEEPINSSLRMVVIVILVCLGKTLLDVKKNFSAAAPIMMLISTFIVNCAGGTSALCMIFSIYPVVTALLLWFATGSVKDAFENKLTRED